VIVAEGWRAYWDQVTDREGTDMERAQLPTTAYGDNLDRLLGLLRAAQAEQDARPRVDLRTACLNLLGAIDGAEPAARTASPAAA
jgi:hypothetical protein